MSFVCVLVGSLAIIGFPFLTGFYSKDLILELSYSRYIVDGLFIYNLAIFSAFFTAVYSFRLIMYVFCFKNHVLSVFISKLCESELYMIISVCCLAFLSVFVGYFCNDFFMGWGSFFWKSSLFLQSENFLYIESEFVILKYKLLPIIFGFFAFFSVYVCLSNVEKFYKRIKFLSLFRFPVSFFYNSWFINYLYNFCLLFLFEFAVKLPLKIGDKGYFELIGPFGIYYIFRKLSYLGREFSPFTLFISILFIMVVVILCTFFLLAHIKVLLFFVNNSALIGIFFLLFIYEIILS